MAKSRRNRRSCRRTRGGRRNNLSIAAPVNSYSNNSNNNIGEPPAKRPRLNNGPNNVPAANAAPAKNEGFFSKLFNFGAKKNNVPAAPPPTPVANAAAITGGRRRKSRRNSRKNRKANRKSRRN